MVARWWLTVDRWTLGALCLLVGCGYIMVLAASPAVAERIHAERDMFIIKQLMFLAIALGIIVAVSMLPQRLVAGRDDLQAFAPPLDVPGFTMGMCWHERRHRDAGHRWLREQVLAAVS